MNNIMINQRLTILFSLVVCFLYFFIYVPQTYNKQFFIQDDEYILAPIFKANSFLEIYKGEFVDIQPVRDLTYWLDYKMQPYFNFSTYKMTNLLWWFSCCILTLVFFRVFSRVYNLQVPSFIFLFLFSIILLHPSMSLPVAWISSRKHLLAFFFILLASIYQLKFAEKLNKKHFIYAQLFYVLSLMSHVIYSPWCLWAGYILYQFGHLNKFKKYSYPFITMALGGIISLVNVLFYKNLYKKLNLSTVTGINLTYNFDTLSIPILAYGRYFYNYLNLLSVNVYYVVYSYASFVGVFIFIVYLYFMKRNFHKNEIKSLLLLFFCSSFSFTFYLLGTFVQNYYSLFITCIVFFSVYLIYKEIKLSKKTRQFFTAAIILFFISEIVVTGYLGSLWKKNLNILSYMMHREDIKETKFWYLNENIYSQIRTGSIPKKEFFFETTSLLFELKDEASSMATPGKISSNMAFKAYYGYLHLLVNNPYINFKIKDEIIKKVCAPFIIYCNFYQGVVNYNLDKLDLASKDYGAFFDQLYRILDHETSHNYYFINTGFYKQWKVFIDFAINIPVVFESNKAIFNKLMDLIIERKINISLMNEIKGNQISVSSWQEWIEGIKQRAHLNQSINSSLNGPKENYLSNQFEL